MVSILKTDKIQASHGTNIEMTSGHTIQPNFHSSTSFPTGHVIQTVVNTSTALVSTTSGSAQDLITASITPKFTNSVIHIEGYVSRMQITYNANAYASFFILSPSGSTITQGVAGCNPGHISDCMAIHGTHGPNSTSSQTYKLSLSTASGSTTSVSTDSQRYTIKLTEIAG